MGVTLYNPQDFYDEICAWIADGKTLRAYSRQEGKPSHTLIYEWIDADKEFGLRFARARDAGHDSIAEECLEISDDGSNDTYETEDGERVNSDHIQRSKLRVWTRLQLLAKWNPKKYGDKVQNEVSGPDGGPIPTELTIKFVDTKRDKAD